MDIKQLKPMIAKITWLYYINDYTQQQIADSMHISRTKVTRYLQKAKEMGLVKITVDTEYHSFFDKEQQLMKMLSLDEILIVPTAQTPNETMRNIGLAGAALLSNLGQRRRHFGACLGAVDLSSGDESGTGQTDRTMSNWK